VKRAAAILVLAAVALAGCKQWMERQPRYDTYAPSSLWPNGSEAQHPPAGTVAQGDLAARAALTTPPKVTPALLARGQQRFDIYCAPCHGKGGDGDGPIVQRGLPAPPSYHSARLMAAPAQHFIDVITHGYGVMYSYADRVAPRDRWAIVAYIRVLQQSRRTLLAEAPQARGHLK
jgi:mono/diheme cytochrome c family protein